MRSSLLSMMRRSLLLIFVCLLSPTTVAAQSCDLSFTVVLTQGAGPLRPGTELDGRASFTAIGESFRQEGGSTAHLASGEMQVGDGISGRVWTLIITSDGPSSDLVGVYANQVEGLSVAGIDFSGPMALTLFGPSGSRPDPNPPTAQEDWDRMDLRRAFSLQAPTGRDILTGDVTEVLVSCE
jgi:hypothetical protein